MSKAAPRDIELTPEAEHQIGLFKKSLTLQLAAQEIARAVGGAEGLACLDIGADNGMLSHQFRKLGGTWSTLVVDAEVEPAVRAILGGPVGVLAEAKLPFKKKAFDVVVVCGFLPREGSADAFIEECHRVLKPDGRLVVNLMHRKPFSLINFFRRLADGPIPDDAEVQGYSEAEVFRTLKCGFDVLHMRTYSRFCVEALHTLLRGASQRWIRPDEAARLRRLHAVLYPLSRLAYQLDLLLLFTRGFRLIATAKRHVWLPRAAPILVDGRSISEAVLSRAAD